MRGKLVFAVLALVMVAGLLQLAFRQEFVLHHGHEVAADGTASDCLVCHDGSVASFVSFCTVQCDFRSSHAVLKPYPPVGREGLFAPLSEIMARGVRLEDGSITCISCHELRNQTRPHLLVNQTDRGLCLVCHLK